MPPGVALALAAIMAPIALGLVEMAFFPRLWFFPDPSFKYAVGFFLLVYYATAFFALGHLGGTRRPSWSDFGHSIRERLVFLGSGVLGVLMFGFVAVQGLQTLGGAWLTANVGEPATRTYTVFSIDGLNPSATCGTKMRLRRAPGGDKATICIADSGVDPAWSPGSRVVLSGRESGFGFYADRIGTVVDRATTVSDPP